MSKSSAVKFMFEVEIQDVSGFPSTYQYADIHMFWKRGSSRRGHLPTTTVRDGIAQFQKTFSFTGTLARKKDGFKPKILELQLFESDTTGSGKHEPVSNLISLDLAQFISSNPSEVHPFTVSGKVGKAGIKIAGSVRGRAIGDADADNVSESSVAVSVQGTPASRGTFAGTSSARSTDKEEELRQQVSQLLSANFELEGKVDDLETVIKDNEETEQKYLKKIKALEESSMRPMHQTSADNPEVLRIVQENETLKDKLIQLNANAEVATKDRNDLVQRVTELCAELDNAEEKIGSQEKQIETLRENLRNQSVATTEVDDGHASSFATERARLLEENRRFQEAASLAQVDLDHVSSLLRSAEERLSAYDERIHLQGVEISNLQISLEEGHVKNSLLQHELEQTRNRYQESLMAHGDGDKVRDSQGNEILMLRGKVEESLAILAKKDAELVAAQAASRNRISDMETQLSASESCLERFRESSAADLARAKQELEDTIVRHQKEMQLHLDTAHQVHELEAEIERLRRQCEGTDALLKQRDVDVSDVVGVYSVQLAESQIALDSERKRCAQFESLHAELENELESSSQTLAETRRELEELKANYQTSQTELRSVSSAKDELDVEISRQKTLLCEMEAASRVLQNHNDQLVKELSVKTTLHDSVAAENSMQSERITELSAQIDTAAADVSQLRLQLQALQDQNASLVAERDALLEQLENMRSNTDSLLEQVSSGQTERSSLVDKLSDLTLQCSVLTSQQLESSANVSSLTMQNTELQKRVQELEESRSDSASTVLHLESQLDSLASTIASLTTENSRLREKAEQLVTVEEQLKATRESLTNCGLKHEQDMASVSSRNLELQISVSKLGSDLESVSLALKARDRLVVDLESALRGPNQELHNLKNENDALRQAVSVLEDTVSDLHNKAAEKDHIPLHTGFAMGQHSNVAQSSDPFNPFSEEGGIIQIGTSTIGEGKARDSTSTLDRSNPFDNDEDFNPFSEDAHATVLSGSRPPISIQSAPGFVTSDIAGNRSIRSRSNSLNIDTRNKKFCSIDDFRDLERDRDALRSEVDSLLKQLSDFSTTFEEARDSAEQDRIAFRSEVDSLLQQLSEMSVSLTDLRDMYNSDTSALRSEIDSLLMKLAEAEDEARTNSGQSRREVEALASEVGSLLSQVNDGQEDVTFRESEVSRTVSALEAEISSLLDRIDKYESLVSDLRAASDKEKETYASEISALLEKLSQYDASISEIREDAEREKTALANEIDSLLLRVKVLETDATATVAAAVPSPRSTLFAVDEVVAVFVDRELYDLPQSPASPFALELAVRDLVDLSVRSGNNVLDRMQNFVSAISNQKLYNVLPSFVLVAAFQRVVESRSRSASRSAEDDDPESAWTASKNSSTTDRVAVVRDCLVSCMRMSLAMLCDAVGLLLQFPSRSVIEVLLKGGSQFNLAMHPVLSSLQNLLALQLRVTGEGKKLSPALSKVFVSALDNAVLLALADCPELCSEDSGMILKMYSMEVRNVVENRVRVPDENCWFSKTRELSNLLVMHKKSLDAKFICTELCPHISPVLAGTILSNFNSLQRDAGERVPLIVIDNVRSYNTSQKSHVTVSPDEFSAFVQ
eukprot:ANDGO_03913.mRNA.1 hypothetical protein